MTPRRHSPGGRITSIQIKPVRVAPPQAKTTWLTITSASRLAIKENKAMRRASWPEGWRIINIPKTSTCCAVTEDNVGYPNWEPGFDDLAADDWEVTERTEPERLLYPPAF